MGREIGLDTGISAGLNLRVLLLEEESGNYCGKTETSHQVLFARFPSLFAGNPGRKIR